MADQGMVPLVSVPPASDPDLSSPKWSFSALFNFMSGPYLLCEPNINEGLRVLRSLASAIVNSRKKPIIVIRKSSSIVPAVEVPVEPDTSGSNSTTDENDVAKLLSVGPTYIEQYANTHGIAHLDAAVQLCRLAVDLRSTASEWRGSAATALSNALEQRYEQTGDIADLDESILLRAERLAQDPLGHPGRGDVLNSIGNTLYLHYNRTGDMADLQDAIFLTQESLELRPQGHPLRAASLNNLASHFFEHYEMSGNLKDLEDIIALSRESLECCQPGDPSRYTDLNNLSTYLRSRFQQVGNLEDLEGAISLQRESLELCPQGHRGRDSILTNLAGYLDDRYDRTSNVADLDEAITLERESLDLCPPGHPNRAASLNNLSGYLSERFTRVGNLEDLEDAIRLQRESLALHPPGHPTRDYSLNNLARLLSDRPNTPGSSADLEEVINLQRECLELQPRGHPFRDTTLHNLSWYLAERCDLTDNAEDLVEAINLQRESHESCSPEDPIRATRLVRLASYLTKNGVRIQAHLQSWNGFGTGFSEDPLKWLTRVSGFRADIVAVIQEVPQLLQEAAQHAMSATNHRMVAAALWRTSSRASGNPSELEATRTMLNLMDLAVAESVTLEDLSNRLSDRDEFKEAQGIASDAAALAIERGDLTLAVSLLEQGRSIIYSQLGRYRSAIDDAHRVSPELAARLVDLSVELDALVVRGERVESKSNLKAKPFDDDTSRHFNTRTAWNQTIEEIRRLPGLESFLLPPPFERLREAAKEGPVIIVNINERRSDAIIIYSEGEPVLVPLPDASPGAVQEIIEGFGEHPASQCTSRKAISLLQEIWAIIVEAVATRLLHPSSESFDKSRIWWCPTGIASKLPLHAAGPYKRGEKNLSHLFVSSYTPTLGTLIRARKHRGDNPTTKKSTRSILIVGQPDTPRENPLPQVVEEVEAIMQRAPHASVLLSSDGTKEAVLGGILQHAWLHLACHGHYDTNQPFHSSFSMHDGRITLIELIGRDLPNAELAFLSACHSARANDTLPDEALHPAAGMMFAGYKSVIGTMWAFDDSVGSKLAGRFYELMVEGKKDYSDAAVVLADAMQDIVASDKKVPFMQKINVVHYGV